jgi:GcrA cell cycle regulator
MDWNASACVPQNSGTAGDNRLDSNANEHGFDPPAELASAWTEDRVALLIRLREENATRVDIAKQINEQTGSNFTKSAVCGKIDRLFPAAKPRKTEEEKAATYRKQLERDRLKKREARNKAKPPIDMNRRRAALGRVVPEPYICQPAPGVAPLHIDMEGLDDSSCHWPYGDNPFTFCGHQVLGNLPYCAAHCRIAYLPPKSRKEPGRYVAS